MSVFTKRLYRAIEEADCGVHNEHVIVYWHFRDTGMAPVEHGNVIILYPGGDT